MDKKSRIWLVILTLSMLVLGYGIDRVSSKYFTPFSFEFFFGVVFVSFIAVYKIYRIKSIQWNLKYFIALGMGIRLLLFFADPNLSDDYFRFIWDGTLINNGINPFVFLPSEVVQWPTANDMGFTQELYSGFNSQHYYSVYPPVNQGVFFLSALIGQGNIFVSILIIRSCIIIAEFSSLYFLGRLLQHQNIPLKNGLWYAFNPLILLEFTVNLHFESIMIACMLGALYFLVNQRFVLSGVFWALAICTKLMPVIYLVFLIKRYKVKQWLIIGGVAIIVSLVLFLPFWNSVIPANIQDSLDKYFGYFEFNAGIPYFIRYIGYEFYEYSILFRVMPIIKKCFIVFVALYGFSAFFIKKPQSIFSPIYYTALIYFLVAGILHPWYITFLIPLGLLSRNYAGVVWSLLIFLSYSAYQSESYQENMWLIGVEFGLLFLFLFIEKMFGVKSIIKD